MSSTVRHASATTPTDPPRVLGVHDDRLPGSTVVLVGGVHGNEPAGVAAISRVLEALAAREVVVAGKLVGVVGNRKALARGRRFLNRDLNRGWSPESCARLLSAPSLLRDEDAEQFALLEVFEPLIAESHAPVVFIDLHTSSGRGAPFCCMADVLRNREIALGASLPIVLGLEEVIDGSMLGYLCDRGHVGVAFEGGRHDDPSTIDHLESVIWSSLVTVGLLDRSQVPDLLEHRERLRRVTAGLPRVFEIRRRHVVAPDDAFAMLPGFSNFTRVRRGQALAHDRRGTIESDEDCVVMLPRYQGEGDDGFFLARPVSRAWLTLSAALRRARLDRFMPRLVGAQPHPERIDHWVVNGQLPAPWVTNLFHLFGYRRVRSNGDGQTFSRRRPDYDPDRPSGRHGKPTRASPP